MKVSMATDRSKQFPIGASMTVEQLQAAPYQVLAELREHEPVSWVPAIGTWLITRRDLAVEAMRDAETFTVDDPRFTTGAVIGPSMLSLDGPEHERHRGAFAPHFRPALVRDQFEVELVETAQAIVDEFAPVGRAELRTALAGPLAVTTISRFLGWTDIDARQILSWYSEISDAIVGLSLGHPVPSSGTAAIAAIHERVMTALNEGSSALLSALEAEAVLQPEELPANTAVLMFGAIETSEGMTANLLWHLLTSPDTLARVTSDRSLLTAAMEESLRLEPAAAVVDRFATRIVELGGAMIAERDKVTISLLGANRDPAVFPEPDRFDIDRPNLRQHVTFVQGPHGCLGLHLARLETHAGVSAVLDGLRGLTLDSAASSAPAGLIFRKPASIAATWQAADAAARRSI